MISPENRPRHHREWRSRSTSFGGLGCLHDLLILGMSGKKRCNPLLRLHFGRFGRLAIVADLLLRPKGQKGSFGWKGLSGLEFRAFLGILVKTCFRKSAVIRVPKFASEIRIPKFVSRKFYRASKKAATSLRFCVIFIGGKHATTFLPYGFVVSRGSRIATTP